MQIEKNSRQIPSTSGITADKHYSDILYAWLQCKSERVSNNTQERRIHKSIIKWQSIERDMERVDSEGNIQTPMKRKTIKKYFTHLEEQGLIKLAPDDYYYLTVLDSSMGSLIEYNTLLKLLNTVQRHVISIYVYLLNRYIANGEQPYIATIAQIKNFIGIATTTSSNNDIIDDSVDILKRLGLLDFRIVKTEEKTMREFVWVVNKLPL